jgi:hypothetical protein
VLSLCLSRACLGKMNVFIHKWQRKKTRFRTAAERVGDLCPARVANTRDRPCSTRTYVATRERTKAQQGQKSIQAHIHPHGHSRSVTDRWEQPRLSVRRAPANKTDGEVSIFLCKRTICPDRLGTIVGKTTRKEDAVFRTTAIVFGVGPAEISAYCHGG